MKLVDRHFPQNTMARNGHNGGTEYTGNEYYILDNGEYIRLPCTKENLNVAEEYDDIDKIVENGKRYSMARRVLYPNANPDDRITVIIP